MNTPTNGGTATSSTYSVAANTGSGYTVSENTPPSGWDFKSLSCDDPDGNNPSVVTGRLGWIKVSANETVTCTWVNTKQSTLKVVKKVDGTQVAGWTVNASTPAAPATITPGSVVTNAATTADFTPVEDRGRRHLGDTDRGGSGGYTNGSVACTGPSADQNGAAGTVNVTVKPGETWTCTFNNTTNTGTIKVIKKVDNVQVAGWTVNATSPAAPATITPGSVVTNAATTADFAVSKVVTVVPRRR